MNSDPFLGQTLGKYRVLEKIGQGGMGVVYKGRQLSLNRSVAIKVLPKQMAIDQDFVQRFLQEAEVIARLAHDNIVYVFDIDQFEGTYYIVMEYVDGHSLRQYRGRPLPADQVQAIGIPVARALDYAHQRAIVHRDVKSGNVMVTSEGKVKLMDFGIAKSTGGVKTVTGSVLGTPEYMAPEQARGERVTAQSDVYALGVLLYELAVGDLPFAAEDPFALALKHISEEPVPPSHRQPPVPTWLDQVILRAMAKDLGERYPSAAALEEDLRQAGGGTETTPAFVDVDVGAGAIAAPVPPPGAVSLPPPAPPPGATPVTEIPPATPATPAPGISPPPATPAPGLHAAGAAPSADTPATPVPSAAASPPGAAPAAMPIATPTPGTPTPAARAIAALRRLPPAALAGGAATLLLVILLGAWLLGGSEAPPESRSSTGSLAAAGTSPTLRQTTGQDPTAGTIELDEAQRQRMQAKLLLDQAEQHLREGRREEALRLIDQVLAYDPENERALALRRQAQQRDAAPPPARPSLPPPRARPRPAAPRPAAPRPAAPRPAAPQPAAPQPAARRASVSQLWYEAETLKDREHYHSLTAKLDEVLAADPNHEMANKWHYKVNAWILELEEDMRDEVDSWLDEFVDSIDGKDLEDLDELWGQRLDSRTAKYFRNLFGRYPVIRGRYSLGSVRVRDKTADFTARIEIRAKPRRGLKVEYKPVFETNWNGRLVIDPEIRFTRPFP